MYVAHSHQIPVIVDNTFATYLFRPIEHGPGPFRQWLIGGHGTVLAAW